MTRIIRRHLPRFEIREGGPDEAWKAGANGENGAFSGIWIWSGIENRAAVAAQELYEWRFRMLVALAAAIAAAAVTAALAAFAEPLFWWLIPLATWAAFVLVPQLHPIQRRKELKSHEIEVQAAVQFYGVDAEAHRTREIGSTEAGGMFSYAWLKGMSLTGIRDGMKAHTAGALRWIDRNRTFLEKVRGFEGEG